MNLDVSLSAMSNVYVQRLMFALDLFLLTILFIVNSFDFFSYLYTIICYDLVNCGNWAVQFLLII